MLTFTVDWYDYAFGIYNTITKCQHEQVMKYRPQEVIVVRCTNNRNKGFKYCDKHMFSEPTGLHPKDWLKYKRESILPFKSSWVSEIS